MAVAADRDVRLMDQVAKGDRGAFTELFDRHSPIVLGVVMQMLRRRDVAEEILQEAFLQAWNNASTYRPARGSVRGWLLMMARSRAIDHLRAEGSRVLREERASDPRRIEDPVGPRRLEQEQERNNVMAALEALNPDQRRCIELAFWEGLSHREVAERLDQPLGTVKSRILLGMNKLRDSLSPRA